MLNAGLFSSKSDDWFTPRDFFLALDAEYHFTLDPCATTDNATCPRFFTLVDDGLAQPWSGRVFMNPPYGRRIGDWVRKACQESCRNCEVVVCLLPARTDTAWFHDWCLQGRIEFVRGRLKFGDATNGAPFPSMVVVFERCELRGACLPEGTAP